MLALSRLFEVWFDDKEFSVAEILAFATDHQGKLVQNNPPIGGEEGGNQFDVILAELSSAMTAAGATTSSEAIAKAVQKARTFAKAQHLELIKDTISKREGGIREQFGKESVAYLEFFPLGVSQYREMKEADVLPRVDQFRNAAQTHKPALLGEINGLRDTWVTLSGAAAAQSGLVTGADSAQDAALAGLKRQLMRNALTIALAFLGDESKAAVYFDESKLHNRQQSPPPPPPAPPQG